MSSKILSITALVLAAASQSARASIVITNATFSETATVNGNSQTGSTATTVSEPFTSRDGLLTMTSQAETTSGSDPSLSAFVSVLNEGSTATPSGSASAALTYYFAVTGGTSSTTQILIDASGSFGGGTTAGANMTVVGSGADGTILNLFAGNSGSSASVDQDFTINVGELYTVTMTASATLDVNSGTPSMDESHASIDPMITLVTGDANGETLNFSSNLGAPSQTVTPEPATLGLLGIGLTGLGMWRRRKPSKKF